MLPLDTVLTRVVTQRAQPGFVPYKGAFRTLGRIVKEEGLGAMYSSLPAKLVSVVPAIGIQVRASLNNAIVQDLPQLLCAAGKGSRLLHSA